MAHSSLKSLRERLRAHLPWRLSKPPSTTSAQCRLLTVIEEGSHLRHREALVGEIARCELCADVVLELLERGAFGLELPLQCAGMERERRRDVFREIAGLINRVASEGYGLVITTGGVGAEAKGVV